MDLSGGHVRVLLAGGGSGGSAAPVIAVAEAVARMSPGADFLYVTTTNGPERTLVRAAELPFAAIRTGRLRRYLTWRNLTDPGFVAVGMAQAVALVRRFRPDVAFGAGGFATVPPLMAARLARVPIAIHQQDVLPGLANRMLRPFADQYTVALPDTRRWSRWQDAQAVGNPVRSSILAGDRARAEAALGLEPGVPTVLVTGGGTGAMRLNELTAETAGELLGACQLVHLTGAGKAVPGPGHPRYHQLAFLSEEMADVMTAADVVVTRAGMSALAEIGALRKAAIVVPMPASHQELNAAAFGRRGAAIVLDERSLAADDLARTIRGLIADPDRREALGGAAGGLLPADAADQIARRLASVAPPPSIAPRARQV